nr:methyltransferase domain-containing protein [uncultured Lichenicoccus sp.]
MSDDFRVVSEFYASRGGRVAARLLRRQLAVLWPDLSRLHVLGLGHAQPFLSLWQRDAALCIAAETKLLADTQHLGSATCIVDEQELPFPDLSFDRILLSHALETSASAPRLLRNVWRLLKDDGRLMLMVPNRRGLWAHRESTPFGQGAPWSRGQIDRLLAQSLFRVERSSGALWMPPADIRPVLRLGRVAERTGARLAPQLSGVLLIEAVKDVYAAMPTARRAVRRVLVQAA